jgi:adenylosuccinate synthase
MGFSAILFLLIQWKSWNIYQTRQSKVQMVWWDAIKQVDYEVLPGWNKDITNVRSYQELPVEARRYVERIEELVELPIHYIGVGPGRHALIVKV